MSLKNVLINSRFQKIKNDFNSVYFSAVNKVTLQNMKWSGNRDWSTHLCFEGNIVTRKMLLMRVD